MKITFKQLLLKQLPYYLLAIVCYTPHVFALSLLNCDIYSPEAFEELEGYLQKKPNDRNILRELGVGIICKGRTIEGLNYIQKAVSLKDPIASTLIGTYYKSDKRFKKGIITLNPKNYQTAIYYFEQATRLISNNSQYPTQGYNYIYEHKNLFSVAAFLSLNNLYAIKYIRIINGVFSTDALETLNNLQSASQRCLNLPTLSAWGERQNTVYNAKQGKCQAYFDLSKALIPLEKKRIPTIKSCKSNLKICKKYQQMFDVISKTVNQYAKKIASFSLEPLI